MYEKRKPVSWIVIHETGFLPFFNFYASLLTAFDKRETFLEAVFLWKTPFEQALSISTVAAFNASNAAALSFAAIAASTFFIDVLTLDLIALFLAVFVSVTKILFFADLILANLSTSKMYSVFYLILTLLRELRVNTIVYILLDADVSNVNILV